MSPRACVWWLTKAGMDVSDPASSIMFRLAASIGPMRERFGYLSELVSTLTTGEHPVVIGGFKPTVSDFGRRLTDIGHVFIKFTGTKGGTISALLWTRRGQGLWVPTSMRELGRCISRGP